MSSFQRNSGNSLEQYIHHLFSLYQSRAISFKCIRGFRRTLVAILPSKVALSAFSVSVGELHKLLGATLQKLID